MINFNEEIKKFHPVMEIGEIEKGIVTEDMSDLIDLVKKYTSQDEHAVKEIKGKGL